MHEVLVNRLGGLSLSRKSVVRLTDRPDMTLDVYGGRKTTIQQQQQRCSRLKGVIKGYIQDNYHHFPYENEAPVAKWVKRWPTDLPVPSSSPARGEIFSTVN